MLYPSLHWSLCEAQVPSSPGLSFPKALYRPFLTLFIPSLELHALCPLVSHQQNLLYVHLFPGCSLPFVALTETGLFPQNAASPAGVSQTCYSSLLQLQDQLVLGSLSLSLTLFPSQCLAISISIERIFLATDSILAFHPMTLDTFTF